VSRPFPSGWFHVATTSSLERGDVRSVRRNGRELVAFRTETGKAVVTDAHCPHLGAHLAHGGTVEGETLRCPFHGFRWDAEGRCVATPYAHGVCPKSRLGTYPSDERHGFVFAYFGGGSPTFSLPPMSLDGWSSVRARTLTLRGHVEDVAENGVDYGHFAAVHRYSRLADPYFAIDGATLHTRFGFDRQNPFVPALGAVSAVFDTVICGLGYSVTDLRVEALGVHYKLFLLASQIDDERFEFTIGATSEGLPAWTRRGPLALLPLRKIDDVVVRFMLGTIVHDVLQDEPIWAHRRRVERPDLVPGDGPIAKFRAWARQFYGAS
jgi:nitrite reductase/ring-hydroxylating ferredoxin subunit